MPVTLGQCLRSGLGAGAGSLPGIFCWRVLEYGPVPAILVTTLGVFVGFTLTLPSVSGERVLNVLVDTAVEPVKTFFWPDPITDDFSEEEELLAAEAALDDPYTPEDFPGPDSRPGQRLRPDGYRYWLDPGPESDRIMFAVIGPRGDATAADLVAIGRRLQAWKAANEYGCDFVGLDHLLRGEIPKTPAETLSLPFPPDFENVALVYVHPEADTAETADSLEAALAGLPVGMIVSPGFYIQMMR